ncbi:hypothetical protein HZA39_03600 [Candidatus Peregrinibacteria bacterium]|nr:hypothetical protein [Candidatus Peregrinibacteria bacterium]
MNTLSGIEEIQDPEPLKTKEDAEKHILDINQKAAWDYAEYQKMEKSFAGPKRIIMHCSDGRIDMSMFYDNPFERFRNPIIPMAGNILILKDEFRNAQTIKTLDDFYSNNRSYLNELFNFVFSKLIKENPDAIFDLQSHSASPNEAHHGCGAHSSDTANALTETAKLAYLISKWDPSLQIIRTHNCTDQGRIYPAFLFDNTALNSKGVKTGIAEFNQITGKFNPQSKMMEDLGGPMPIFSKMKNNHFNIDTKNHAEQTILVSNTPFAHHRGERQALRLAWHPEADFLLTIIKKLAGIIQKNYLNRHPDAPIILHLDIPQAKKPNPQISETAKELMNKAALDPEIANLVEQKQMFIIKTITDAETYRTRF